MLLHPTYSPHTSPDSPSPFSFHLSSASHHHSPTSLYVPTPKLYKHLLPKHKSTLTQSGSSSFSSYIAKVPGFEYRELVHEQTMIQLLEPLFRVV